LSGNVGGAVIGPSIESNEEMRDETLAGVDVFGCIGLGAWPSFGGDDGPEDDWLWIAVAWCHACEPFNLSRRDLILLESYMSSL